MAAGPLPATLGFLTDAAHLLVTASPETSAYLMSQRNSLMFNTGLDQPDVQRQHVCGCCGHIMIFGRGDVLKIHSSKTCRKKIPSSSDGKAKGLPLKFGCQKTLTCSQCGRYTNINLPTPAPLPKRRPRQTSRSTGITVANVIDKTALSSKPVNTPILATSSGPTKISSNASSKKRAKTRKQGLQALLQQSSNSKSQSGLGLSLADFMQN